MHAVEATRSTLMLMIVRQMAVCAGLQLLDCCTACLQVATVDVMQGDLRSCLTAAMAGKFDLLVRPQSQLCALHPAALYSSPLWPCRSAIRLTCPHLRLRSLGVI